jgi:hypothetical protein
MATVQPALYWGNPHCQLHVVEQPGGVMSIMLGLHCIEVVAGDVGSVQYRMAMGRLLNAGWEVTALAARRGHDTRTLRLWGEALLCPDPAEMLGRLSGRGAAGKVTVEMVEFVLDWSEELCGRVRNFRARILAKVEQVFRVKVTWEALRPALLARRRERAAERLAASGCEPAAGVSAAERAGSVLDGLPLAAAADPGVAPCVAAGPGAGADGCVESSSAAGCAIRSEIEAGSSGETQVMADPRVPATAPADAPGDGVEAHSGGGQPAIPCANGAGGETETGAESQPVAGPAAAVRLSVPALEVIPGGSAVPARGPVLVHHAGQVLAARWLDAAAMSGCSADGMVMTWCAQILQGAVNIEQQRDIDAEALAWFTGVAASCVRTHRELLIRLLSQGRTLWLEVLRGNALLLDDGPGRGTVFYYDPHTKEYTGGLPFLKGWCGRRHGVAKVLHLDFFHTRSGHPCFVFPADNYEDMRERFFAELELFDQLFAPADRRGRLFVIDRGIYGIETFERFSARGDRLLTWEKDYADDGWVEGAPEVGFTLTRPRNRSDNLLEWTFRVQEQPWRRNPAWRRFVVRATNPEGRTIEVGVLCSDPSIPTADAVTLIFSRWLQENDFRILDQYFGMMQMTSRRSQAYADLAQTLTDRPVESIEYRELHAAATALRRSLQTLLYDRERVADTLTRMDREDTAARLRLERDLPRLRQRLERCQANPDACGKHLRELAALGALAGDLERCRNALRTAARGRPKLETRREVLQVGIDSAKSQSDTLEQRLKAADREDSKLRFLAAAGACRPDTAAKHLMDCTRIVARNVFYCMFRDFRRHYDNRRDDMPILRLVTRAAGTLRLLDGVLHIGLWLRASLEPAVRAAIDGFLADVSGQINSHFAGRAVPVQVSLLPGAPEL